MLGSVPAEVLTDDFGERSAERITAEQLGPRLISVLDGLPRRDRELLLDFPAPGNPDKNFGEIVIHPAALPDRDAIFIGGDEFGHGDLSLQLFVMHNNHPPVCVPGTGLRAERR